jgi:hypothetical protein
VATIGYKSPIGKAIQKDKIKGSNLAGIYNEALVGSLSSIIGGGVYMADILAAQPYMPLNVRVANAQADRKKITDIIENDLTWQAACIKEKELINFYGRFDLGKGNLVNMTNGGDGIFGLIFSEESKRKISEGNKNKIMSQEAKIKIGLAQKGNKHCLGKHRSEETKIKIGLAQKGMKRSEETKRKMREAWKKRKIK